MGRSVQGGSFFCFIIVKATFGTYLVLFETLYYCDVDDFLALFINLLQSTLS